MDKMESLEFFKKAMQRPCHHRKGHTEKLPDWVDLSLIKDGQAFIKSNFFSIFVSHFLSLLFGLCYSPVHKMLLKTGKSYPTTESRQRYLSTLTHIKLWYDDDILSPNSRAFRDIRKIGLLHSKAEMKVNQGDEEVKPVHISLEDRQIHQDFLNDCNCATYQNIRNNNSTPLLNWSNIPFNQLDMIVTQFCFTGLIYLFPRKFGLHFEFKSQSHEQRGMKGFLHIWAVLGYLLGIEDEFNLCLEKNQHRMKDILTKILIPDLFYSSPSSVMLWDALVSGIASYICCLKLKAVLLFFVKNVLELHKGSLIKSELFRSMTFCEMLCYSLMHVVFRFGMKLHVIVELLNFLLRSAIIIASYMYRVKV